MADMVRSLEKGISVTSASGLLDATAIDAGYRPFIVEGEETGEFAELRGGDGVRAGVFRVREGVYPDRTPVPYLFETDEYIWVVEGEVHVETSDGEVLVLKAGDSAYFRAGSESTWTFHAPFRKFSVEIGLER